MLKKILFTGMRRSSLFLKKKMFSVLIFLLVSNGSLTLSNSLEKFSLIEEKKLNFDIPLFIQVKENNLKTFCVNPYFFKSDVLISSNSFGLSRPSYNIMTNGIKTAVQLTNFLVYNNSNIDIDQAKILSKLYIEESEIEGVNHDIAFIQMCLETGFCKYGGLVNPDQNNFCGLGATDKDNSGERFSSKRLGIRAHIQHLKAYASTKKINLKLIDKRFRFVKRGIAPAVQDLTGRWASDPDYDKKIKYLLSRLYS